jgi:hypothetical protein
MVRHQRGAVKDLHCLLVNHDFDMIPDEPMRHTVAHGVDVDERIVGDATPKALLATRQRADGQRS